MSNAISISDDVLVVFSTYSYTIMGVANGAGISYPSEAPVSAVTQWVSLMEPELLTLHKHRFQPWVLSASWFTIFSFFCSVLWIMVFPFVSYLLTIVLFVLWFTTSDDPFVSDLLAIVLCVLWFTTSDDPFVSYILAIVVCVLWFTTSDDPFVSYILPLYCVSFDLRLPMTLWFTTSDDPFGIFKLF